MTVSCFPWLSNSLISTQRSDETRIKVLEVNNFIKKLQISNLLSISSIMLKNLSIYLFPVYSIGQKKQNIYVYLE